MTSQELQDILDGLPASPGCYLMKGHKGQIVYVGKAGNLRNRVRQYFLPGTSDTRFFVRNLQHKLSTIDIVVTASEKEALLLEYNLIQRHLPRYNIRLTDDKRFLCLRFAIDAPWPRLELVRKPARDKALYFGPYHSAGSARETLRLINRHFKLRKCTDRAFANRVRPCMQHQIKRCLAPCCLSVDRELYLQQVVCVRLFLEGKRDDLLGQLKAQMQVASTTLAFEKAAILRDQIRAVDAVLSPQRITELSNADLDVIGIHRQGFLACIVIMEIVQGRMVGVRDYFFTEQRFPNEDLLSSFINQQYNRAGRFPDELLLDTDLEDAPLLSEWLSERKGRRVVVRVPKRGKRRAQVRLARINARHAFNGHFRRFEDAEKQLLFIQRTLHLPVLPRRIECVDIAHLGGQNTVAGISCVEDGRVAAKKNRTFKVRKHTRGDDYAAMEEILNRRFLRARDNDPGWAPPDLLVVDGGRGQLNIAGDILKQLQMPDQSVVALAKEREEGYTADADRVFLPGRMNPVKLKKETSPLFLLAMARDEAHRLANSYQARRHRQQTLRSRLDDIPGIGQSLRKRLLRHFGSVQKIAVASLAELEAVDGIGPQMARRINDALHSVRKSATKR